MAPAIQFKVAAGQKLLFESGSRTLNT